LQGLGNNEALLSELERLRFAELLLAEDQPPFWLILLITTYLHHFMIEMGF